MKTLRWLILVCHGIIYSQASFNFEGDSLIGWRQSPENRWEISSLSPLNGSGSLHHAFDNPVSGVDYAWLNMNYPLLKDSLNFTFRIRHSYNPSSGNNWQLFFLSQHPDDMSDAFVFGVNFDGSDDRVKLWQVANGIPTVIIDTEINYEMVIGRENAPIFSITRQAGGAWRVEMDVSGEGKILSNTGEGVEQHECNGKYLGLRYSYSSAQDRKIWMDDLMVLGTFFEDTDPPEVIAAKISGLSQLEVIFSEVVIISGESVFSWNGLNPDSVSLGNQSATLNFPVSFPNRQEQKLSLRDVKDPEGNILADTTITFVQNLTEFGEVIFNEIMSDPEPVVWLPPCEYLELYSYSLYPVDLKGWTLSINSKNYLLGEEILDPGEYLVISSEDQECIFNGENILPLFPSKTTLTNSGASLKLFDQYQRLIHVAEYGELSEYDLQKAEGGFSLERIDPNLKCGGRDNWTVSCDRAGGTPGRPNSKVESLNDSTSPEIKYLGVKDSTTLTICFSETIILSEQAPGTFTIDDIGICRAVFHTNPLVSESIDLIIPEPVSYKSIYSINIDNVFDCEENKIISESVVFALPGSVNPRTFILSEVMYDPFTGKHEYIEFYNSSGEFLDLGDLKYSIASESYSAGTLISASEGSHLVSPGSYVALTENEMELRSEWELDYTNDVVEVPGWKSMPNGNGNIALFNRSGIFMEHLSYHDSMHHELLRDPGGVSLERLFSEKAHPNDRWMSASAFVNYGTPAVENSQRLNENLNAAGIEISPAVFSPDMDGFNDYTEIVIDRFSLGSIITIVVTDLYGGEVARIIENGICGNGDRYTWDGHDTGHNLVFPGIYVIHTRISGGVKEQVYRNTCAVIYR